MVLTHKTSLTLKPRYSNTGFFFSSSFYKKLRSFKNFEFTKYETLRERERERIWWRNPKDVLAILKISIYVSSYNNLAN